MSTIIKKTVNYAFLYLHYKATVELLLKNHNVDMAIIKEAVSLVRDFLKNEVIVHYAEKTRWEKYATIPIVIDKNIVDTDITTAEDRLFAILGESLTHTLLESLDELLMIDTLMPAKPLFDGWSVLSITEKAPGFIEFIHYGDYRVLAWEHMIIEKPEEDKNSIAGVSVFYDNPSLEDINRLLNVTSKRSRKKDLFSNLIN